MPSVLWGMPSVLLGGYHQYCRGGIISTVWDFISVGSSIINVGDAISEFVIVMPNVINNFHLNKKVSHTK